MLCRFAIVYSLGDSSRAIDQRRAAEQTECRRASPSEVCAYSFYISPSFQAHTDFCFGLHNCPNGCNSDARHAPHSRMHVVYSLVHNAVAIRLD